MTKGPGFSPDLVERMWGTLDTLESDGEIVATVRQIRRLGGAGVFERTARRKRPPLKLVDPRWAACLRGLGFMLRRYRHSNPEIEDAKARAGEAFIGGEAVEGTDLLLLLVFVRQLIEEMAQRSSSEAAVADMNEVMKAALETVKSMMGN